MKKLFFALCLFISTLANGQDIDTLAFYSDAFQEERTIYIHKPNFYKYKSDSLRFPVIYLLDGQHSWLIDPILSEIKYLQISHEVPNAIIVVIPHKDRNKECRLKDMKAEMPLDIFITSELDQVLSAYQPSDYRLIMGHSFSASFALHSYNLHPEFYRAVIAHSPLDQMDFLIEALSKNDSADKAGISMSFGGEAEYKDHYHHKNYHRLKALYPDFFYSIELFEANHSSHNAVPLVATPYLLSSLFADFKGRFANNAKVDENYQLLSEPDSVGKELQKIAMASTLGEDYYPPEIPEINGLGSRYSSNNYEGIAIEVYQLGISLYPQYYEFYLELYSLISPSDLEQSKVYLEKAEFLLETVEDDWEGKSELLEEIKAEKESRAW